VIPRSYLYVPGDQPDKLAKAAGRGADALIIDLEDAVPADAKQRARDTVAGWLSDRGPGPQVWVRLNSGPLLPEDVAAVAEGGIDGVYLPKVSSVAEVEELDRLLAGCDLRVVALIETAQGILDAPSIARAPRVVRLAIGEADLCAELRISPSPGEPELGPMRAQVILASAAAGTLPPVAPVSTDFRDLDALLEGTLALRRMGFGARAAIHPAQVEPINRAFTPTPQELDAARRLVESYARSGGGVTVDDSGRMVDEAVVRRARQTLLLAGRDEAGEGEILLEEPRSS
jgi:citrate lyase subunit beta/citryl-CoA lyase